MLDRTYKYSKAVKINDKEICISDENPEITYFIYTYIAQMVILGKNYERKGDIRIENLWVKFTNLPQWIGWKNEYPTIHTNEEKIIMEFNRYPEKTIKLDGFDIAIKRKYYFNRKEEFKMQLNNEFMICIENIEKKYINSATAKIEFVRNFLILCMNANINIERIDIWDHNNKKSEMILSRSKNGYENRSIIKNIIKYNDIEDNLEHILEKWKELYVDNELLIVNFSNLQTREDPVISEYTNLVGAIENLFLATIKKKSTKVNFAEILKTLIRDTNFILNLTEDEIQRIAISAKEIRRYGIHSNKEPKEEVINKFTLVSDIMTFLIEVIRARIMLEIGIDKRILEKYYNGIESLKGLKEDITKVYIEDQNIYVKKSEKDNLETSTDTKKKYNLENMLDSTINDVTSVQGSKIYNSKKDVVQEEEKDELIQIANQISRDDTNKIAELNAIMQTSYREVPYDLNNTKDLIEATKYITAEYMDYYYYWGKLENITEEFDRTVEVFNPQIFMGLLKDSNSGSELIDKNVNILSIASDSMLDLLEIAEDKCKNVWKVILVGNNIDAKKYFLGDDEIYTAEEFEEIWEYTMENLEEFTHTNVIYEDCMNFAKLVKKQLKYKRK